MWKLLILMGKSAMTWKHYVFLPDFTKGHFFHVVKQQYDENFSMIRSLGRQQLKTVLILVVCLNEYFSCQ